MSRTYENEDYINQNLKFTVARSRLIPLAALLVATALGGCVAYTGYPSSTYSYSYPNGYYVGRAVQRSIHEGDKVKSLAPQLSKICEQPGCRIPARRNL